MTRNDHCVITLKNCDRLKLCNLSIDYDPLPFTQGVITARTGRTLHFTIDQGYPPLSGKFANSYIHVFDPAGRFWKKNCPDVYGKCTILDPTHGTFQMRQDDLVEPGDRIVLNLRNPNGVVMSQCSELVFEDITLYTSPGVAFHSRFCKTGGVYRRVRIIRGPRPAGADRERLFASAADGINIANSRGNIKIENCEFSWLGDDGINLHGELLPVARKKSDRSFETLYPYGKYKTHFEEIVRPGDTIRFLRKGDYAVIGEAKIVAFQPGKNTQAIEKLAPEYFPVRGTSGISVYEVTLDRPVTVPEGCFFDIPAIAAAGFEVKNNFFHDHRARGIRIMSSHGVIENNRFERIKQSGVTLGAEYSHWREAGWCEDVVVRGNRFLDVGYGMIDSPQCYAPGVIALFARLDRYPGQSCGNRKITIADNVIVNSPGAGIFLFASEDVTLRNNQLKNCAWSSRMPGKDFRFANLAPVWRINTRNIIEENTQMEAVPRKGPTKGESRR